MARLFGKSAVTTHCTWPNLDEYIRADYDVNRLNKRHGLAGRYALHIYNCTNRLLPKYTLHSVYHGRCKACPIKTTYGPDVGDWCPSGLITDVFDIPGEQLQLFLLAYN